MARVLIVLVFVGTVAAQPAPRSSSDPFQIAIIAPPEWRYLQQTSVREELKITPAQKAVIDNLVKELDPATAEACSWLALGYLAPEDFRRMVPKAQEHFLKTGLTAAQQQRVKQIVFQLKEREFGAYAAFTMAAKDLALTGDQLEDVASIKGQRIDDITKLVTSGERFEKVKKKVETANGDTYEKMAEMLTRTQRERLKGMRGIGFDGKLDASSLISVVVPRWEPAIRIPYPADLYGYYDFELRHLANAGVRALELKVTNDQNTAILNELDAWEAEYKELGNGIEKVIRLHDRTAKAPDTILNENQRKRFDEIMARRRLEIGESSAMCGYPAAVSNLKLSPAQLNELKDGKPVREVLTPSQSDLLDKLPGKPFHISLFVVDPVRKLVESKKADLEAQEARSKEPAAAFARRFLIFSDRLRLSADQIKKLRELAEDEPKFFELIQRELSFGDPNPVSTRSQPASAAVADKFRDSMEQQCFNVLDEKQQSMARQIFGRRK